MRGIEAALYGVIGKDPELKTSKAGKPYLTLSIGVDTGDERDDGSKAVEWIKVTTFGEIAEHIASTVHKGEKLYCEGSLRLDRWQDNDGLQRFGLSMACFKAQKVGVSNIGRNRPKVSRQDDHAEPAAYVHQATRERPKIMGMDDFSRSFDDQLPF